MDRTVKHDHPFVDENAQSPKVLNTLELQALPAETSTGLLLPVPSVNLSVTSISPSMPAESVSRSQSKKRSLIDSISDDQYDPQSDGSSSQSLVKESNASSPPLKKAQRLAPQNYRDTSRHSFDSEAFQNVFNSPTFSDSQNSDASLLGLSSFKCSFNKAGNASLGSLGSLGDKFFNTTLNSLKGFPPSPGEEEQAAEHAPDNVASHEENAVSPLANVIELQTSAVDSEKNKDSSEESRGGNTTPSSSLKHPYSVSTSSRPTGLKSSPHHAQLSNRGNTGTEEGKTCQSEKKIQPDTTDDSSSDEFPETFEGNADLHDMFVNCRKNPKHKNFHSPSMLKVSDLPPEIQHQDTVTFLNCISELVVQITVYSTSAARGPKDMYSQYIGTNRKRNGSGFIANVDPETLRYRCKRTDCPEAPGALDDSSSSVEEGTSSPHFSRQLSNISTASTSSGGKHKHYYYSGVNIRTNKHVIFDKSEADNAYVKFFFNSKDEKDVTYGHVGAIVGINDKQDHIILHVMSHDRKLFNLLESHLRTAQISYKAMIKSTDIAHQIHAPQYPHSWVAVISHPHGAPKLISLGRVRKEKLEIFRVVKYYDAGTCPGSSGGLVITPTLLKLQWPGAVHSNYSRKTKLNVSLDSRFPDLQCSDVTRANKMIATKKYSFSDDHSSL